MYFGTSLHSIAALDALHEDPAYEIVAVVSQPDKPVGRKQEVLAAPVSSWATSHNIELITPKSWKKIDAAHGVNEYVHRLRSINAEFAVLCYYGRILPQSVIDVFPKGIVNIHPSLLPLYRGPTPGQMVILDGEKKSGVSIMLLVQEQDAGPIIAQEEFDVSAQDTPDSYYTKGFKVGTDLLMKALPGYLNGANKPYEQDHSKATFTPLLSRDNGKIDWTHSVIEIERMIRAFTPWPGTWTEVWVGLSGKILFEQLMKEKLGFEIEYKEVEWKSAARKRFLVHSAIIREDKLALYVVQIEGKSRTSFDSLKIE